MKPDTTPLDELLKSARPPVRSPGYWEQFPHRITAQIRGTGSIADGRPSYGWWWAAGVVAAGLAVALCLWLPSRRSVSMDYARMYREIEGLFPNQVEAIVSDRRGVWIVLARSPDVPASPPLLIEVCGPTGCRHVITFSGQEIEINGSTWDVLVNADNRVLVVGPTTGQYRITARELDRPS